MNESIKIRKNKVTTSFLIRENKFAIYGKEITNFARIHKLFLGQTTVIRTFLSK